MQSLIIWIKTETEEFQSKLGFILFRMEFCKGYVDVENFFQETVESCKMKAVELNKI